MWVPVQGATRSKAGLGRAQEMEGGPSIGLQRHQEPGGSDGGDAGGGAPCARLALSLSVSFSCSLANPGATRT